MKNPIKRIKEWLAFILTLLVVVFLFGIIFIELGITAPTPSFYVELSIVVILTVMMKIWWYDYTEEKRLNEQDILEEKEKYYRIIDSTILDTNDLDKYLVILNQENRDHFIKNKIGSRTAKNLSKKTKWLCFIHPEYKKMTAEEIGVLRYNKLYFKIQRKADKLPQIKSEEIMALSDSELLYDAKNHLKAHKRKFQTFTTILSIMFSIAFAMVAWQSIKLNWANVFRFVGYLGAMAFTISWTIMISWKQTGDDTFDYFSRLKFIVDKYATYKKEEVEAYGNSTTIGVDKLETTSQ